MTKTLPITGPDAERFLQGQIMLDVRAIGSELKLSAMLSFRKWK